jgi:serine/threonine-protein kinase
MDAARWERLQELFHRALAMPEPERGVFVHSACETDRELGQELLRMLDADRDHETGFGSVDASEAPLPDSRFGPYRIVRRLGEGGMSVVYLGVRDDLNSVAAIKVLREAWVSEQRRDRFLLEQRTLAQLSHPAIARLYDADTLTDGTPWFAMEFVEGVSLTRYCERHQTSIEGRLELFLSVCEAVQHAHSHAVIHRDLKPSNVLVDAHGLVKLLDFGIAKQLDNLDLGIDQTLTGVRPMTPAYASPEQLRGERVGIRSDIYSLGVILYELVTQRLPFDFAGQSLAQAIAGVAERTPERPSQVVRARRAESSPGWRVRWRGRLSWSDLDVICVTALHLDPARRYQTVEAMMRDVQHYLAGEPLEARPDSVRYRLGKFIVRRRGTVIPAAIMAALLFGSIAFYTSRLAVAHNRALREAARSQRIERFMLDLFEGEFDQAGPADDLRVVTLVDRGVEQAAALSEEPVIQAELQRTLAGIYRQLGKFEQAEGLLLRSLETQRRILGGDHVDAGLSLVDLGLVLIERARLDEAEQAVREGLAVLARQLDASHPSVAHSHAALAQVFEAKGNYDEAIRESSHAVELLRAGGENSPELLYALSQLADSHYYAGHYPQADQLNQTLLENTRSLYGEHHPRVADVLINLGATHLDRGEYAQAEAQFRAGLAQLERFYGPESFRAASAMTMLGRSLVYQQRFAEATPLLERALGIQERVHGAVHPRVASALNDLGSAALQQAQFDRAEGCFRRMLSIYREVYGQEHQLIALAGSNLASTLARKRQLAQAELLYREAVGIYERTQSPEHLNTGIARIKLGRVLVQRGKLGEAEDHLRAGYRIVSGQASAQVSWLQAARTDLATICDATGRQTEAERMRAEHARYAEPTKN